MYESPIEIIVGKIKTKIDDDIVKAVRAYHINVNKDELVKALCYDRDQYNNGYTDGRKSLLKCGEWIPSTVSMECVECSVCGYRTIYGVMNGADYNYCPNCGADNRRGNDNGPDEYPVCFNMI